MRRKKKNEKIDIYTALMLPLMTLFLLNMGLVATTWAWYTASISTGINTITAGPKVEVIVKNGEQAIPENNGKYELKGNETYTIVLKPGNAETGYIVLMDIEEENTSINANILNLFFTPAYAKTEPANTKYYVELRKDIKEITITTPTGSSLKQILTVKKAWCERENGSINSSLINGYESAGESINLNPVNTTSYTINLLDESGNPLKQSEVNSGIAISSENATDDQPAVITEDDTEETQVSMPNIDGYELVSVNGAQPKVSYLLVEGQENVFNAVYKKIDKVTEQNGETTTDESEENTESNNVITEDNGANVEISEQTDPVDESIKSSEDPEPIQKTTNTTPEQPATVPQEQQQNETTEAVDDVPVSHSESTSEQESTEVVENVQGEI